MASEIEKKIKRVKTTKDIQKEITLERVKKTKEKKGKIDKEMLKIYVFEKLGFGYTHKQIANETGYSINYIDLLCQEIDDEYSLELKKCKEYQIKKQIKLLDGISRKLFKALENSEKEQTIIKLQDQILKTEEYKGKLMGLLTNKLEVSGDVTGNLLDKFNILEEEKNDGQEIT